MYFDWFDYTHHKYAQYKQKGFVSFLLIVLVLVGAAVAGYLYLGKNFSQFSLPTPKTLITPTPSSSDPTANWKTYTNKEIGISFKYPSEWGELETREELCLPEGGPVREYQNQPCVHIQIFTPAIDKAAFLVTQSELFIKYGPGRGAYWGDRFSISAEYSGVTPEKFIDNYCVAEGPYSCVKQTNQNNVSYIKSLEDEKVIESRRKALYYFISHPTSPFPMLLWSNQNFLDTSSLEKTEVTLDQMLSTFKFTY